jgi:hypothetical protein
LAELENSINKKLMPDSKAQTCPKCGQPLSVPAEAFGTRTACNHGLATISPDDLESGHSNELLAIDDAVAIPAAPSAGVGKAMNTLKPAGERQALVTAIFAGGSILCYVAALYSPALEGDGSHSLKGLTCLLLGWMSAGKNSAWLANLFLVPALFILMTRGLGEPPKKRQISLWCLVVVILAGLALILSLGALGMKGFIVADWEGGGGTKWPITSIGPGCYLWIASVLFTGMGAIALIFRDLLNLNSTGTQNLLLLGGVSAVALSVAGLEKYEKPYRPEPVVSAARRPDKTERRDKTG